MTAFKAAWCGALALIAALTAVPAIATEQDKLVIARIDGQPITGAAFAPYLRAYLRTKLYHAGSPERSRALAQEAIDAFLVDRVLAEQAAARALKVDPVQVEKRLASLSARLAKRPEWPEIQTRLPELRQEIETDLRIGALKHEISRVEPPTEADIRAFYDKQSEQFTRPAGYRLKMLLVAVEPSANVDAWRAAEAQAQDYARRVAAGENFATLARANSKHGSAEKGGTIGLVHEGQLGEAAEAVLRAATPGAVAGPVRLLEGVAIFEVDEKRAAELLPLADVKERAVSLIERERAATQWNTYLETTRKRFSIDQSAFADFIAAAIK